MSLPNAAGTARERRINHFDRAVFLLRSALRVRIGQEFRVLYVSKFAEAIYVLHAFEKKSQKTAQRDLVVAAERLGQLLRTREVR